MDFVGNVFLFPAVKKNLENPLRIDKVIAMSLVYYFFLGQSVVLCYISMTLL